MLHPTTRFAARIAAACLAGTVAIGSLTASAQPAATEAAAASVATQPSPNTTVTTVPAAGGGQPVIVVNTNVPVSQPSSSWEVEKVDPTPAPPPAPTFPDRIHVELHSTPTPPAPVYTPPPPPSPAEQARLRKIADQSRARGLMVAGWATFGGTYAFSALTGTIAIDTAGTPRMRRYGAWMTIPVVGPFAAAFYTRSATGGLLTTALGVAQGGGLLMALVGGARNRRLKRELSFAVAPTGDGGGQIGVSGRF